MIEFKAAADRRSIVVDMDPLAGGGTTTANGKQAREWIRELSLTLYRMGADGRIGERESILSTTADAIARSHLGCPAQELEWPNSVG